MEAIVGRDQDVLIGLDGHRVFMPAIVFDDLPGLLGGQWHQHRRGHAELRVMFRQGQAMDAAAVEAIARHYVGPSFELDIRFVDRIERTAAGKQPTLYAANHSAMKRPFSTASG